MLTSGRQEPVLRSMDRDSTGNLIAPPSDFPFLNKAR